jgi:hypothetical protein
MSDREPIQGPGLVAKGAMNMAVKAPAKQREVIPGLEDVIGKSFPAGISFESMNAPVKLIVTEATKAQARDFKTKQLRFWDKEETRPMMVLVVTGIADGEERTLWFDGKAKRDALSEALRAAGTTGIAVGDVIEMAWTGNEPVLDARGKPLADERKLYTVSLTID